MQRICSDKLSPRCPEERKHCWLRCLCAPRKDFRLSLAAEIVELDEKASLGALQELYSRSHADELERTSRHYRLHALVR